MALLSAITAIVKPVSDVFTAGTKRKQAKETGDNKIRLAQVDGDNSLNLTDAEWEAVTAKGNSDSYKDEYATLTMTAWVWVALYGAIMSAHGKPEILNGVKIFVEFCTANGIDIGFLTTTVVTAAVGLKIWRGR